MSLQARLSAADPRLYSPDRDVAHNFRYVIELVAKRMESGAWPELHEVLGPQMTADEQGEACKALILFVHHAAEHPKDRMQQALDRSGFLACNPAAQVALMAYLGTAVAGLYYHGAKMATISQHGRREGPCEDKDEMATLLQSAQHSIRLLTMPAWKRPLYRLWNFIRYARQ